MSLILANLKGIKKLSRAATLALQPEKDYNDGRTKQCHADECDINKIMARFDKTGTISHLAKHEGSYADYSDFDFLEHSTQLTRGREIFDDLPAEIRREFGQNPQAFFEYVNDPANAGVLEEKLPALAEPGTQLPRTAGPNADSEAAHAAAGDIVPETLPPATPEP